MEEISWFDKVTNMEVPRRVNKYWTRFGKGNIDGLVMFRDTTDFCMKLLKVEWEVNQRGSRRMQMLHDLANDGGYVAHKRAAEDKEGWRHREGLSETCCTAENY